MLTPKNAGFRMPAEWDRHQSTWLAWPSHEHLWKEDLDAVRLAVGQIYGNLRDEAVDLLVPEKGFSADAARWCMAAIGSSPLNVRIIPFGDIWLRDTAPIFLTDGAGRTAAVCFAFNGWGRKYVLEHDDMVSTKIAAAVRIKTFRCDAVFEGGSIDVDGCGTALTTRACLLNPNRNPGLKERDIEERLRDFLGLEKILWLNRGLVNDHTDGHVDNIARFVTQGMVACMKPAGRNDPNADVLDEIRRDLQNFRDAVGQKLDVVSVPSPGRVLDAEGKVMSASYLNFYVGNGVVLVPIFGVRNDDAALKIIAGMYPNRRVVGIDSRALLTGGGTIHCITQQQPARGVR
ncbi:agmatine deiminase family protein [Candidatus Uhrbacteria bacterium]|nr:agmatine deiminase family protein [Candidatus Uhrbacteria bacterium]